MRQTGGCASTPTDWCAVLCCVCCCAGGPSVACSTATAALWDAAWAGKEDPSGRAVAVHELAYETAKS